MLPLLGKVNMHPCGSFAQVFTGPCVATTKFVCSWMNKAVLPQLIFEVSTMTGWTPQSDHSHGFDFCHSTGAPPLGRARLRPITKVQAKGLVLGAGSLGSGSVIEPDPVHPDTEPVRFVCNRVTVAGIVIGLVLIEDREMMMEAME
ncbi:hypothetical protein V6N11_025725 [Hibiscus sabdariffa]|uniref:Uncharacterized protein n=1 Tax=Hibiscus sabdariffa TaxID=183260 RepID=A0ABR2SUC5_9ROSI